MAEFEPTLVVSLTVDNGSEALDFYAKAFDAVELYRITAPDGSIGQAEFVLGNSHVYLSEGDPAWHAKALGDGEKAPCMFALWVENCDDAFQKALEAGAEPLMEPQDQFWGMRTGMVKDKYGYRWNLRHTFEEVPLEEIMKRAKALMNGETE